MVENLLTGRHARIRTNPLAEMLFLPSVRREEVAQREAVERSSSSSSSSATATPPSAALPFGIQKIVGFARALALEPAVLLLDEPSAGLNREEREDLARFILRIKHELGIAMIWIEHDMQMVADLADRIHVLDYGRTLAEGPPERCWPSERDWGLSRGRGLERPCLPLIPAQAGTSSSFALGPRFRGDERTMGITRARRRDPCRDTGERERYGEEA